MKKKKVNYSTSLSINGILVPKKYLAHWIDVNGSAEVQKEDGVSTNLPKQKIRLQYSTKFGSQATG